MPLTYTNQELSIEDTPLHDLAVQFGTPCYVYSQQAIVNNWQNFYQVLAASNSKFKINYAVKANSNIHILALLKELGACFDVVSYGEIARVLQAGGKPQDIVFAGVGKSTDEITKALDLGIYSFHVESEAEILRISTIASQNNKVANIALRINPDVTTDTHPYITTGSKNNKFGIDLNDALNMYLLAKSLPNLNLRGITCHIGSQINTVVPFIDAIEQLLRLVAELKKHDIELEYIDIGGGFAVAYNNEQTPTPKEYLDAICQRLQNCNLELHIEPGRAIVANAGILLTKVEYLKTNGNNNFAIVDCAMNDFMRPALYQSNHAIVPAQLKPDIKAKDYCVVGPVCESSDNFSIKDKSNLSITSGDLLAIKYCGAYGFAMSSNYNTRARCAEVLINGNKSKLIRKRETIEQILQNEIITNEHATSC